MAIVVNGGLNLTPLTPRSSVIARYHRRFFLLFFSFLSPSLGFINEMSLCMMRGRARSNILENEDDFDYAAQIGHRLREEEEEEEPPLT